MEKITYSAFHNSQIISSGELIKVITDVKKIYDKNPEKMILILCDSTGRQIDFNLNGDPEEVLARIKMFTTPSIENRPTRPGRPKLGVISREVSLLPHHWEWLNSRPQGTSTILRKLIDEAQKKDLLRNPIKHAQEVTDRASLILAGNLDGYEEAMRSLYRKEKEKFDSLIAKWPKDIKTYIKSLSKNAF